MLTAPVPIQCWIQFKLSAPLAQGRSSRSVGMARPACLNYSVNHMGVEIALPYSQVSACIDPAAGGDLRSPAERRAAATAIAGSRGPHTRPPRSSGALDGDVSVVFAWHQCSGKRRAV